jgi:signal transduction histidine kinase
LVIIKDYQSAFSSFGEVFKMLQKMSLRSKLLIITAISLLALLIAFLSAWRTAQMSETFALRQAESSAASAARDILREANADARKPKRRLPTHEQLIFERYADAPTRSVALALRRFAEVSGGFCDQAAAPQGFVSSASQTGNLTASESNIANIACRQSTGEDLNTRQINIGNETFFVASVSESGENPFNFSGAFAFRSVPAAGVFADKFNLLTQAFLLLAAIGLAAFSFLTWRGWQGGMRQVKTGLAAISGDLTARIELPPTLELAEISRSINDLSAHLEANLRREAELEKSLVKNEKLAALGRVAAGVAHEVRNPLASMKLKIQLAERNKFEPAKIGKTFDVLQEEIERLDNLVKKLLDLSRPARLNFSPVSLTELIEQRLSLISEKAAAQNVRLEFEKENKITELAADGERLAQIFDNLFRNALEAMPDGGRLKISLEKESDVYRVQISDEGKGFSEAERERLFEPFYTTKDGGTGLGLAISREIAEAHGGKLYLLDKTENGAALVVELPEKSS